MCRVGLPHAQQDRPGLQGPEVQRGEGTESALCSLPDAGPGTTHGVPGKQLAQGGWSYCGSWRRWNPPPAHPPPATHPTRPSAAGRGLASHSSCAPHSSCAGWCSAWGKTGNRCEARGAKPAGAGGRFLKERIGALIRQAPPLIASFWLDSARGWVSGRILRDHAGLTSTSLGDTHRIKHIPPRLLVLRLPRAARAGRLRLGGPPRHAAHHLQHRLHGGFVSL